MGRTEHLCGLGCVLSPVCHVGFHDKDVAFKALCESRAYFERRRYQALVFSNNISLEQLKLPSLSLPATTK